MLFSPETFWKPSVRFALCLGESVRKFSFSSYGGQSVALAAACKYNDVVADLLNRFDMYRGKDLVAQTRILTSSPVLYIEGFCG